MSVGLAGLLLGGCSMAGLPKFAPSATKTKVIASAQLAPPIVDYEPLAYGEPRKGGSAEINRLITKYAGIYGVPESLIHRVVRRESTYNPRARNGPYWGLMQIRHDTARSMGYKGDAAGLLDADTNLRYAVKYLRGAWIVGDRSEEAAVRHYSRGYYYDAKRKGLLEEVGLR